MYNRQGVIQSLFMREVSASKINRKILAFKNKLCHKSVHSARILKVAVDVVAGPIANIVNKSIQTSHFPNSLKLARVGPIYRDGSTLDIINYLLVCMLPLLNKIF